MTREEHIENLKAIASDMPSDKCSDWIESLMAGVKALEQEPKVAYWEWNQYDANPKIGNFHCSLCHSIGRAYFDYCPYCGANMSEIQTVAEGSDE